VLCHRLGKVVPPRWQSCAKPKKKFGTNGICLTGIEWKKYGIREDSSNRQDKNNRHTIQIRIGIKNVFQNITEKLAFLLCVSATLYYLCTLL